jgi:hypothetical protein
MLFQLETRKCPSCGKPMIKRDKAGLFPRVLSNNQDAQNKKLGVVYVSRAKMDGEDICEECELSGKSYFTCCLCGEKRTSDRLEDSYGDPAEYLCKDCYETVPAKQWDEKVKKLQDAHRWDFE